MESRIYRYEISLTYFANDEKKHFSKIVEARDNVAAMAETIGYVAWHESTNGRSFTLDTIHYECL